MKGLELSKEYFYKFGLPMLEEKFKDEIKRMAIGLVGHGSECFMYDDDVSLDHDFEPGFIIWLTEEDEEKFGFKLMRAYQALPKEYKGYKVKKEGPFGSKYKGVHTIKEFYSFYTGGSLPESIEHWMSIPDYFLAEATNGEVFIDNLGEFTKIRNILLNRPNDIWIKKLSSSLFYMAQTGQYNYNRCIEHKELAAASLSLSKFSEACADAIYLINHRYRPYYKWLFKGMRSLPILGDIEFDLEELLKEPYNSEKNIPLIESISIRIGDKLRELKLSDQTGSFLEPYAYCVNNKIQDLNLRFSPIMEDKE